jgi:hypothetical protein
MNGTFPISLDRLPPLFALLLAGGSLAVYFAGAILYRFATRTTRSTNNSFNLAIPITDNYENLFAVSLAAAQTTFSTVFIVFLIDAPTLGLHFLYCPAAFAVGNWFMLHIYKRVEAKGHLDESVHSGLPPSLVYKLTNSRLVAYCVVVACALPLIAVLALELHFGIAYLDYLDHRAFSLASSPLSLFVLFVFFITLLLSYVFLGGFRAVIASDIWQYRILAVSLPLVLISIAVVIVFNPGIVVWKLIFPPFTKGVVLFYMEVTLMNLFQPLCFATTWQRFRAFRPRNIDFAAAVGSATKKVAYLWTTLILIGVGLQAISHASISNLPAANSLPPLWRFLDQLVQDNVWFAVFVFPLLTLAGFSGMYSSADTCVSALLYLTESNGAWRGPKPTELPLAKKYRWAMLGIFGLTLAMYTLYSRVDPNEKTATSIALTVFGNCVIAAPIMILLGTLDWRLADVRGSSRSVHILSSIGIGILMFWSIMLFGPKSIELATLGGLVGAAVPAVLLYMSENVKRDVKVEE